MCRLGCGQGPGRIEATFGSVEITQLQVALSSVKRESWLVDVNHRAVAVTLQRQLELPHGLTACAQPEEEPHVVMVEHAQRLKHLVGAVPFAGLIVVERQRIELLQAVGRHVLEHGEGAAVAQKRFHFLLAGVLGGLGHGRSFKWH